jgi:hypothetical protein
MVISYRFNLWKLKFVKSAETNSLGNLQIRSFAHALAGWIFGMNQEKNMKQGPLH